MDHHWVATTSKRELPRFAVTGGRDHNDETIYVGRCYHEGDLLPALVRPGNECAFVSWGEKLFRKDEYEILVGPGYGWSPGQRGGVPYNAVSSGNCSRGEPLYIGRGHHNDCLYVGKVLAGDYLYIPFGNGEKQLYNYEVLVQILPDNWLPANLEMPPPPDAVLAGSESDGSAIYVARAMHDGVMLAAKFVPARREAYAISDRREIFRKQEIELLCGRNNTWLQPRDNDVPSNAVFTGRRHDGEAMVVGRAEYKGSLTPGLVAVEGNCVTIAFGETAVCVENYEVLIKHHL